MIEQDVTVTTRHGRMPAFAACPDGPGPFPPIIFYMDAPGTREELRHMARRQKSCSSSSSSIHSRA